MVYFYFKEITRIIEIWPKYEVHKAQIIMNFTSGSSLYEYSDSISTNQNQNIYNNIGKHICIICISIKKKIVLVII